MPLVAAEAVEEAGFFAPRLDRPQATPRHGVSAMTRAFISLEGGEGAGKSTQLDALAEALRGRGSTCLVTREPGGSPGAEAIRELLLEGDEERWNPRAEALLFAAARADHVEKTIQPALRAGRMGAVRPLPRQLARLSGRGGRAGHRSGAAIARFRQRGFPARPDAGADARRSRRRRPRPGARQASAATASAARPPSYHAAVDARLPPDGGEGARTGQADRRQSGHRRTVTARLLYALADLLP